MRNWGSLWFQASFIFLLLLHLPLLQVISLPFSSSSCTKSYLHLFLRCKLNPSNPLLLSNEILDLQMKTTTILVYRCSSIFSSFVAKEKTGESLFLREANQKERKLSFRWLIYVRIFRLFRSTLDMDMLHLLTYCRIVKNLSICSVLFPTNFCMACTKEYFVKVEYTRDMQGNIREYS